MKAIQIKITDLTIKYGEKTVISDFSYNFYKGSHTAIIAPSGAGKTSLINAIMGFIPFIGKIEISDDTSLSTVFQEDRLCEGFSCLENIKMCSTASLAEINTALCEFSMSEAANKKVHTLSGGMKRRTAILRALLHENNLLILDEPFKGLDNETKERVMAYIKKTTPEATMILITHDISEAEFFNCDIIKL